MERHEDFKKGWFELTAKFCPVFGEKIKQLGRSVFTIKNMELLEDILKDVERHEKDPAKVETIKYIWWGIRRLMGDFPNESKK